MPGLNARLLYHINLKFLYIALTDRTRTSAMTIRLRPSRYLSLVLLQTLAVWPTHTKREIEIARNIDPARTKTENAVYLHCTMVE